MRGVRNISPARIILLLLVICAGLGAALVYWKLKGSDAAPPPLSKLQTIAGASEGAGAGAVRFTDPFGVAVGADMTVYVTDGEAGKVWQIPREGSAKVVAENLDTPSAIAVAPDGSLVLAETGAHVIRRIHASDGRAEIVAGQAGRAGFADGSGNQALFNGAIGVAVGADGQIYVADTYNDRIRAIDVQGNVRTIAGTGEAGFADGIGIEARFDTPCGIAVAPDGALIVADTGNQRIRRVSLDGSVRTISGTGEDIEADGMLFAASFNEPVGVAVEKDGTIYVTDYRGSTLRLCGWTVLPQVTTFVGGDGTGFQDGAREDAKLNHPTGVALAPDGTILIADTGNRLVRALVGEGRERGEQLAASAVQTLFQTSEQMRAASPPRWPYSPPERTREIAATFGEIRGALTDANKEAWFHNGLDIPGGYGEPVRAVRSERILNPLSVEDVETARERIRFPTLGYIHVRIGRDASGRILDEQKFIAVRDEKGSIKRIRVRRGTRFDAGETIGTLNNQNHVHLIAGTLGAEFNALAALDLPGIKDTVAPVIEKDGVRFFDSSWRELRADAKDVRLQVSGDVRIVVRAYDQMDGNAARRRLGLYRLGYQVLTPDGTPASGFDAPQMTISFESLPRNEDAAQTVYATGSRSGATGETIFAYIVTNIAREREAQEAFWSTAQLPPGDYILRVIAEDFFGNRTTHDTPVRVVTTEDQRTL